MTSSAADFPRLRHLLALVQDQQTFLAEHPTPALVFDRTQESDTGNVETPSQPFTQGVPSSTEVLGPLAAAQQLTRMADLINPEAQVGWLVKSDRNPFGGLITLGRARNNDLVIKTGTVSKLHAIFTQLDGRWTVQDDASANGTFLNGARLPGKQKTPVSDGDALRFGPDVQCRLYLPESLWQLLGLLRARP